MAERKHVLVRLDPAVHDALAKWAADELRSVNAQIEYALRMALKQAGRDPKAGGGKLLCRGVCKQPYSGHRAGTGDLGQSGARIRQPRASAVHI
ncbi:MAG: hypothetical protein ACRD0P_09550 [Stackebrandtia sp.]